jgi:hypothetical protein
MPDSFLLLPHVSTENHSYLRGDTNVNLLKPSGFFTYHQVNIQKFYMVLVLLWLFVRISEQKTNFALYFINWLVFITVVESVYSAVRADSSYKADYASRL